MAPFSISSTFVLFASASLALAVTPGPAVIYLVTRTLNQGRTAGLASIGGIVLGDLGNAAIASLGLAVVFEVSAHAFMAFKFAGAAYLVFLGIQALRSPSVAGRVEGLAHAPRARLFRDAFMVALLNPKTALFFAAFLPQFIDPSGSPLGQSLLLACVFVSIAACTDTLYVLAAGALGPRIIGRGARRSCGRYVTATSFIALGIFVACSGFRSGK
jgi:threonine/homoserine/homoserine lactone efflux protein